MTSTHTGFKLALKHCFEQLGKYAEVQREHQVLDKRVKGIDSERKDLGSELAKVQKELESVEKEKSAFELEVCHKVIIGFSNPALPMKYVYSAARGIAKHLSAGASPEPAMFSSTDSSALVH